MNRRRKKHIKRDGFTLIELLLVMAIIAILSTVVLVAVNPTRQFAQARDTQRIAHVHALISAVSQRAADNGGIFEQGCSAGIIPDKLTEISSKSGDYDIADCLTPTYLASLPVDPKSGYFATSTDYVSGYMIMYDENTHRITISAPHTEVMEQIVVSQ